MKITIENTSEVVLINDDVVCRVWEGVTESGIKVQCLILRIAVKDDQDTSQFDAELIEQRPPTEGPRAFPLKMVL